MRRSGMTQASKQRSSSSPGGLLLPEPAVFEAQTSRLERPVERDREGVHVEG